MFSFLKWNPPWGRCLLKIMRISENSLKSMIKASLNRAFQENKLKSPGLNSSENTTSQMTSISDIKEEDKVEAKEATTTASSGQYSGALFGPSQNEQPDETKPMGGDVTESEIEGGKSDGMSLMDLAKKHKISLDKIKKDQFAALEGKGFSEKLVELVKAKIKSDLNLLEIQYKNKKAIANLNGTPSPSFDYENHKGGKTSLESLKGKYVYIDVWATWCGPCRAEIPYLKKTEEAYHGKNIEFVSISIDRMKDHDKWKNFVTENELGGIQLFADNDWNSQFVKDYQINGIPRFILVGPKGEIVNADAPRPSSHNLVETIDSLLK